MVDDGETDQRWDKNRVETFSDGVFAIAITLLVLDIHVPPGLQHLGKELEHEWPSYLAYVTSFLTVGGVWIAHHRACRGLRFIDSMMMRLNLLLLMTTAFLPFPTGILAEALRAPEHTAETAVFLYGATVLVIEVVLQAFAHRASSALVSCLLAFGGSAQRQSVETDRLLAGGAAAGPALPDGLQEQHRSGQCQAGRWRFGFCRSSVKKPWAAVTSEQWW
jgi:uncharacterized membrane protein